MKPTLFAAILFGVFAIAFLGRGITGLYFLELELPTCTTNTDCSNSCCQYYNVDYGVCETKENCQAILELTKEEYIKTSNLNNDDNNLKLRYHNTVQRDKETPARQSHFSSIIVGLVLVLLTIFAVILPEHQK